MGLLQNIVEAFSPGGAQGYRSREADIDYEKQATASRKQLAAQQAEDFHVRSLHDLMDQGALPVGPGGVVKRTMYNPGNPSMGTMASGDIAGMPALPVGVGPTNGTLLDKADPSRVITHKSPDGQVFQFELPTGEAQRNRALYQQVSDMLNPAQRQVIRGQQDQAAAGTAATDEARTRGMAAGVTAGKVADLRRAASPSTTISRMRWAFRAVRS